MPAQLSSPPTVAEAARLLRSGSLSPMELVKACLERVHALDGDLRCFIRLDEEAALAAARRAEQEMSRGIYRGPLHGIPIGLKDLFDRRGVATTAHSRVRAGAAVATADAQVVKRLDAAGAIDLGKLAMHEFALGGPSFDLPWPPARNPWDTGRFTHGSSSGTAAAVAAGLVLAGPGTDTAGSIRGPAALCGIAGMKPTYGLVSLDGTVPLSPTLDHAGPMAWTVEDCALLLQAMVGDLPYPSAPSAPPALADDRSSILEGGIGGLRIGVVRHFYESDHPVAPEMHAAIEAALAVFRDLGAQIRDLTLAPLADYAAAGGVIMVCEAYQQHAATLRDRPEAFGRIFRNRISAGMLYDPEDLQRAHRAAEVLRGTFPARMADVDVLVTAVVPAPAPAIDSVPMWPSVEKPSLLTPFNITRGPALALCCGYTDGGLPLSLQIAGRQFDDALVLRVGHAYEQAVAWRSRRPAILSPRVNEVKKDVIGVEGGC